MIVAADPADATGDEVRITRIFVFHEDAVSAEDGGRAVALRNLLILEIDLGEDSETAHNAGDRIPQSY